MPISAVTRCASGEDAGCCLSRGRNVWIASLSSPPLKRARPEIQAQAGHRRIERQRFAIERNGFFVMFLARFEETQVRVWLGVRGCALTILRHAASASSNFPCCSSAKALSRAF